MTRLLDIVLSLLALSVLLWPCLVIAVILRCTGEGEIFFLQERIGKNRKPFKIYKFATMLKNSPHTGSGDITTGNDPRVLPVGKFLRKTKINELPQFINVLGGSLRLVGPRPLTSKIFDLFPEEYKKILDEIPPGVTGIASIVFRDEESVLKNSSKDFLTCYREDIVPYKTRLEQWYLAHHSLITDLKIVCLTVWVIIAPRSSVYFRVFPDLPRR